MSWSHDGLMQPGLQILKILEPDSDGILGRVGLGD